MAILTRSHCLQHRAGTKYSSSDRIYLFWLLDSKNLCSRSFLKLHTRATDRPRRSSRYFRSESTWSDFTRRSAWDGPITPGRGGGETEGRRRGVEEKGSTEIESEGGRGRRSAGFTDHGNFGRRESPLSLSYSLNPSLYWSSVNASDQTARLRQTTHRLSGFTRVASRYISHRSSEVHQALTAYSLHGLEATTSSSGTNDPQAGGSSGSPSGVGLAGISGVGASTISSGGLDPMDLLRAISRADSSRRWTQQP